MAGGLSLTPPLYELFPQMTHTRALVYNIEFQDPRNRETESSDLSSKVSCRLSPITVQDNRTLDYFLLAKSADRQIQVQMMLPETYHTQISFTEPNHTVPP